MRMIEAEHISKHYRLGAVGTGSLRQDMQLWLKMRMKKNDEAFFKGLHDTSREIWALKNVSFCIAEGEAVGIIGSNGSGKSTLLKIISRIVEPTAGRIRGRGKLSSMLEVGTGFHAELTGRENIFMSGYTLGMQKQEIRKKFDEIVDFAGVGPFLDTPVKRYSSGMYVRLAFAVAAHLEPDILIVDEVLAVGDADFQKKCMGKMQTSSRKEGRTIIFVSHSMPAVENLCSRAIWLDKGRVSGDGNAGEVIGAYLANSKPQTNATFWPDPRNAPGNSFVQLRCLEVKAADGETFINVHTPVRVSAELYNHVDEGSVNINVQLVTSSGECVFNIGTNNINASPGILELEAIIPGDLLNNTTYGITLTVMHNNTTVLYDFHHCTSVDVQDERRGIDYYGAWPGIIRPRLETSLRLKQD